MGLCAPCDDPGFLKFNRVCHYGTSNVIQRLEKSLKYFYEWAFLKIGAWTDVSIDMMTYYGGNYSQLQVASGYGYTQGQVWQGFRTNWVYESGVTYVDVTGGTHSPNLVEVYVSGVLQTSGYSVNYPLGQVIFDTPISTSQVVKSKFSFRDVQFYISSDVPWWQEIQYKTFEPDSMFQQTSSGDWFVGGNHRVQLPCIIIAPVGVGTKLPYALGGGKVYRSQEIMFYVLADNKATRDNLADLILEQGDRCIQLVDIDVAAQEEDLPLNHNGNYVGMQYPALLTNHCWGSARVDNARLSGMTSFNCGLHEATVKHTYSVVFSNLC